MARRKASSRTQLRLAGALLLVALVAGAFGWWHLHHWQPDRASYPVQGVEVGSADGDANWAAIKAIGADFAYLDASASAFARDPMFVKNFERARRAGMRVGAVHRYDPCQPADKQAANFVTVVPRDAKMLPPVVELDMLADNCPMNVSDAMIESELTTFLNQVETHTGKPVMLKVSERFEDRYQIASAVDRNLWLTRDRFQPDYGGRPWTLWTANTELENEAGGKPLRWVVAQP
ncbi:MAG: glycoside hydrolase family 25 protein [Novosphingobium sp.]|nr:glycoside hydrolase family 25 protein [Novosphingobium sp.]